MIYLCHSQIYEVCSVRINLPLCVECMCDVWNYYSYSSKCVAVEGRGINNSVVDYTL